MIDVAKQRKDRDANVRHLSAVRGLFLASYKSDFVDKMDLLSVLYVEACDLLGIEPDQLLAGDVADDAEIISGVEVATA